MDESAPKWEIAWQRARCAAAQVADNARLFYEQEALAQTEKLFHLESMLRYFIQSAVCYLEHDYTQ